MTDKRKDDCLEGFIATIEDWLDDGQINNSTGRNANTDDKVDKYVKKTIETNKAITKGKPLEV